MIRDYDEAVALVKGRRASDPDIHAVFARIDWAYDCRYPLATVDGEIVGIVCASYEGPEPNPYGRWGAAFWDGERMAPDVAGDWAVREFAQDDKD